MKFVRSHKQQFSFLLDAREKEILFDVLQLYPLVPPSRPRLSKSGEGPQHEENQRLLEEALDEQRRRNRKHVMTMLQEPGRFRETKNGLQLTLSAPDVEWLLQVFNDVRVGAWLALGEPEELEPPEINKTNAPYLVAMETAGYFESVLLAALGVQQPTLLDEA